MLCILLIRKVILRLNFKTKVIPQGIEIYQNFKRNFSPKYSNLYKFESVIYCIFSTLNPATYLKNKMFQTFQFV